MSPTQAIELARQELIALLDQNQRSFRRYVWQPGEAPDQGHPWAVFEYGPELSDQRPYYVVQVTGLLVQANGSWTPEWQSKIDLFNKPDYLRPTVWDRLTGRTDPPSQ